MRSTVLLVCLISGCGFLSPKSTLNVVSTQPTQVKQTNGTVAVEVDKPRAFVQGVKSVDGNQTTLNFNFNSGWMTTILAGIFGLICLGIVAHALIKRSQK